MTLRSIPVPLDGSPFGEHALPHAISLARRAGATLTLVHVHVPPTHFSSADIHMPLTADELDWHNEQSRNYLSDALARVKAATPTVEVSTRLKEGIISESICEEIDQAKPDLVVLTTHGRGALSRFWLGSVATDLVHRAAAPLLLVRPNEDKADLAADMATRRILIPLDGSPFGEQILPLALSFGSLSGAAYRLLTVVPPVLASSGGSTVLAGNPTVADRLRVEASQNLSRLASRIPGFTAAETHVAVDWPTASAILADAEANQVDLIAMETHGRTGLTRLILGSVADKVLRGAAVPVLLKRPTGE